MLKVEKVQRYMAAFLEVAGIAKQRAAEMESKIASAEEVLQQLTRSARLAEEPLSKYIQKLPGGGFMTDIDNVRTLPLGAIKEISHDPAGDMRLKFTDFAADRDRLARHHRLYVDAEDKPNQVNVAFVQILEKLPDNLLRELQKLMLSGAIDVDAKEVED